MCAIKATSPEFSVDMVTIEGHPYERSLFLSNITAYKQAKKDFVLSLEVAQAKMGIEKAQADLLSARQEYVKISRERVEVLQPLSRARNAIIATQKNAKSAQTDLAIHEERIAKEIATTTAEAKRRSIKGEDATAQNEKLASLARELSNVKKNVKERLIRANRRRTAAEAQIQQLEHVKSNLLMEKSDEIKLLSNRLALAEKKYDALYYQLVGHFEAARDKVIELIQADLDMSDKTTAAILELQPNYFKTDWYIGPATNESSLADISIEIKHNMHQTMAELIASIAESRSTSFADAMVILTGLRKNGGLCYYNEAKDCKYDPVPWTPRNPALPAHKYTDRHYWYIDDDASDVFDVG